MEKALIQNIAILSDLKIQMFLHVQYTTTHCSVKWWLSKSLHLHTDTGENTKEKSYVEEA